MFEVATQCAVCVIVAVAFKWRFKGGCVVSSCSNKHISRTSDITLPAAQGEPPFPPFSPLLPPASSSTVSPVWKPQSLGARGNYSSYEIPEEGSAGRSLPREREDGRQGQNSRISSGRGQRRSQPGIDGAKQGGEERSRQQWGEEGERCVVMVWSPKPRFNGADVIDRAGRGGKKGPGKYSKRTTIELQTKSRRISRVGFSKRNIKGGWWGLQCALLKA